MVSPPSFRAGFQCWTRSVVGYSGAREGASTGLSPRRPWTPNRNGAELRAALNAVLAEEHVPWAVYGEHSGFYFFLNPDGTDIDPRTFDPLEAGFDALKRSGKNPAAQKLRLALSIGGVDISGKPGGLTSAVHTGEDIAHTARALREAIRMLRAEGEL